MILLTPPGGGGIHTHANYKLANKAPRCNRVLANGRTCTQPALHLRRFCRFHDIALKATRRLELAHADSPANLQIAFTQVVSAMLEGRVDQQKGRLCLYGLRLASDNMKRLSDETYGSWDGNLQPSRP